MQDIGRRTPTKGGVVSVALLAVLLASAFDAWSESASSCYKRGRNAEVEGDAIGAYLAYKLAFTLKPGDNRYRASYERLRVSASAEYAKRGERLNQSGNIAGALAAFLRALDVDSTNEAADADIRNIQAKLEQSSRGTKLANPDATARRAAPSPHLEILTNEPLTLHMAEDSRIIYQSIGKTLGINVLFESEYISKRIQVDLNNATPYEALEIVSQISNTFWKPVTRNTIFVAQDTRAKRQTLSQQAVQIFYLKNIAQQNDLNDIQTALRNVLPNTKLFGVVSQNAIMMRATPDELELAKILIADLDQPKPEVLVDITVMEVSRDKLRNIGLSPPTSLTVNSGSSQTLDQIGKSSAYTISIGQAAAEFLLTDSDTRILQNPRLRAVDGQKATLKLGERLPVATGSYTVATGSTSAAAETQFQYLDVGVNVEMTPAIHGDRDVTLKLSVEVSAQSGTSTISGVAEPVISQQKSDQVVRLKDGETSILAGLVKQQESRAVSGWPGFGEIPMMKYFFSTQSHEVVNEELIFMIVPHVVRPPATDNDSTREIDTGTELGVQLRKIPDTRPISAEHN